MNIAKVISSVSCTSCGGILSICAGGVCVCVCVCSEYDMYGFKK